MINPRDYVKIPTFVNGKEYFKVIKVNGFVYAQLAVGAFILAGTSCILAVAIYLAGFSDEVSLRLYLIGLLAYFGIYILYTVACLLNMTHLISNSEPFTDEEVSMLEKEFNSDGSKKE